MTPEMIARWAREAGMCEMIPETELHGAEFVASTRDIQAFAAKVAAHEREMCAALADQLFNRAADGAEIADAIRARK